MCILLENLDTEAVLPKLRFSCQLGNFFCCLQFYLGGCGLGYFELYEIICKEKIHTAFPNVEAILRLFLSLIVTNCL